MTANTGLLTARCDPYGAESRILLVGGVYPESRRGKHMWHCSNRAAARYRMVCTGGQYGQGIIAGLGITAPYACDGGHKGQVMPLCDEHRVSISRRQSGLCPACAFPPEARELTADLEAAQYEMYRHIQLGRLAEAARLGARMEIMQARMNELTVSGRVHRCPLTMIEVS